jgi:hypothetical protein
VLKIDCKLHFHSRVNYTFFLQGLKILGLIRYVNFSFSTVDSPTIFYIALVRSRLLSLGTPLRLPIHLSLNEMKENLQPCVIVDLHWDWLEYVCRHTSSIESCFRRRSLYALFLNNVLKTNLVTHPSSVLLFYRYLLGTV